MNRATMPDQRREPRRNLPTRPASCLPEAREGEFYRDDYPDAARTTNESGAPVKPSFTASARVLPIAFRIPSGRKGFRLPFSNSRRGRRPPGERIPGPATGRLVPGTNENRKRHEVPPVHEEDGVILMENHSRRWNAGRGDARTTAPGKPQASRLATSPGGEGWSK
jgi:hypothetical protein